MTCTCTTIVGPTTAETQPTGRRTSSGRTSTSSGSTAGSGVPCSLNTTTRAELSCILACARAVALPEASQGDSRCRSLLFCILQIG